MVARLICSRGCIVHAITVVFLLGSLNAVAFPWGQIAKHAVKKNTDNIATQIDNGGSYPIAGSANNVLETFADGVDTSEEVFECKNTRYLKETQLIEVFDLVEHQGLWFFERQEKIRRPSKMLCSVKIVGGFEQTKHGWIKSQDFKSP